MAQPTMTPDEAGDIADEIYAQQLRAKVETPENIGKIIAIDVHTGDYEIDANHLKAVARLKERRPDAEIFSIRIGYDAVYGIGGAVKRTAPV